MKNPTTCNGNKQASTSGKASSKKAGRTPVNNLRLHDIGTLILNRHGGWCGDSEWMNRYFFAALPHLIVSRIRWLDAVREWTEEHLPALVAERGFDWIEEQARACHAKPRKTPRNDKLAQLLQVQQHEVIDFGLRTLTAVSRPKKVREAENRDRRNKAKQAKRAERPGYVPRDQSKAALARAAGTTADAQRAKTRRDRLKAESMGETDPKSLVSDKPLESDRVSGPTDGVSQTDRNRENDRVSGPTITLAMRPGFGPHTNNHSTSQGASLHRGLNPHAA